MALTCEVTMCHSLALVPSKIVNVTTKTLSLVQAGGLGKGSTEVKETPVRQFFPLRNSSSAWAMIDLVADILMI